PFSRHPYLSLRPEVGPRQHRLEDYRRHLRKIVAGVDAPSHTHAAHAFLHASEEIAENTALSDAKCVRRKFAHDRPCNSANAKWYNPFICSLQRKSRFH